MSVAMYEVKLVRKTPEQSMHKIITRAGIKSSMANRTKDLHLLKVKVFGYGRHNYHNKLSDKYDSRTIRNGKNRTLLSA